MPPLTLKLQRQAVPIKREAPLFMMETYLTLKLAPLGFLSFLYLHSLGLTPRHKSAVLGSDREGFTVHGETDDWTQKQPR